MQGNTALEKISLFVFFITYAAFEEVDVDKLGHRALKGKEGRDRGPFGCGVLGETGGVDRKKLGARVFEDPKALRRLEEIVHPYMVEEVRRFIEERPGKNVIVNAALLFYMGLDNLCDAAVWVHAPFFFRIRRAMERDGISLPEVFKRFLAQRKLKPQQIKKDVDIYTIRNSGSQQDLGQKAAEILKKEGIL